MTQDVKWARAQVARRLDLLRIKTEALRQGCIYLGISDKGTREEVLERYHREIWTSKYDDKDEKMGRYGAP